MPSISLSSPLSFALVVVVALAIVIMMKRQRVSPSTCMFCVRDFGGGGGGGGGGLVFPSCSPSFIFCAIMMVDGVRSHVVA